MKQITNGKKPFLAVPVPKDAKCWQKRKRIFIQKNLAGGDIINLEEYDKVELLGKLSELTEEQAAELVEEKSVGNGLKWFKFYLSNNPDMACITAQESLKSLLQSNDCWLKEWIGLPKLSDDKTRVAYDGQMKAYDSQYEDYNKASEDFLIILID